MAIVVTPGGTCVKGSCWKETAVGFRYNDPNESTDGVKGILLHSSVDGKAKMVIRGVGPNIPMPTSATATQLFDEDADVVVQLIRDDSGICWEARYPAPAVNNSDTTFKEHVP